MYENILIIGDLSNVQRQSLNANAMTNILIFSLSAIFTGTLFGVTFLSIARTLQPGTAVRNYMIISAYGFILFYVAGSAVVLQATYPPYGLVSVSFTGLSDYLIYNGLFFSNFSLSGHGVAPINQKICNGAIKIIGQHGKEVTKRVLTVAKKTSAAMEREDWS